MMYFVHGFGVFLAMLIVWAIGGSVLRPTLNTLIANAAPADERGVILGFGDSLNNAAMIVALAAGAVIIGLNPQYTGFLPAVLIAAAFVLSVFAKQPDKSESEVSPALTAT